MELLAKFGLETRFLELVLLNEFSCRGARMKVGQAGSLRGGWLPPLSPANAAVGRFPSDYPPIG
jgi:hypothetical protein